MNTVIWYTPLLLLPGVGLLVMSTSARFAQIHGEIHHLMADKTRDSADLAHHLFRRSALFRNALVSLYLAVGFLALSSLLGGIADQLVGVDPFILVATLTCTGIFCLLYASIQLIRESIMALQIIKEHIDEIQEGKVSDPRSNP